MLWSMNLDMGHRRSIIWTKMMSIPLRRSSQRRWRTLNPGGAGIVVHPWESLPESIDFLFVDGPPKAVGEHARAPALAEFASRLAPGSLVLLDDMQRDDEQEIVARWLADPSLPRMELVVGLAELHIYRVVSNPLMVFDRKPAKDEDV